MAWCRRTGLCKSPLGAVDAAVLLHVVEHGRSSVLEAHGVLAPGRAGLSCGGAIQRSFIQRPPMYKKIIQRGPNHHAASYQGIREG